MAGYAAMYNLGLSLGGSYATFEHPTSSGALFGFAFCLTPTPMPSAHLGLLNLLVFPQDYQHTALHRRHPDHSLCFDYPMSQSC